MFDKLVFFLYCFITAKFGETENSLLRYFDVCVRHIRKKHFI